MFIAANSEEWCTAPIALRNVATENDASVMAYGMARPSKYTKAMGDRIAERISEGENIIQARQERLRLGRN